MPLGRPDKTFQSENMKGLVFAQVVQSDDKVIIHGAEMTPNTMRFNADGSKDNSWPTDVRFLNSGSPAYATAIKQIGTTLYFGGSFDSFRGTVTQSLVALNLNGTLQKTFTSLPAQSDVSQIETQSDGKLILRGHFPFQTGNRTAGAAEHRWHPG